MLNENKNIVAELKKILPTYYEWFVSNKTAKPCITYREYRNDANEQTEKIGYSTVAYWVKVWADDVETAQTTAQQIDDALRPMGYVRTSANDLIVDNQICKIFVYTGRGFEHFEKG